MYHTQTVFPCLRHTIFNGNTSIFIKIFLFHAFQGFIKPFLMDQQLTQIFHRYLDRLGYGTFFLAFQQLNRAASPT